MHPALSPARFAALGAAPDARHLEVDANELATVVGAALDVLARRGATEARDRLLELDHVERLAAAAAVVGQALRVPVSIRGGTCDRRGTGHVGNGLGGLLGVLAGREAYSGRQTLLELAHGREVGLLARAPHLEAHEWTEETPTGPRRRKRRFRRSTLYVSAAGLRQHYRAPQLAELVIVVARLVPPAWRLGAYVRRSSSRGYWGAIRQSRDDGTKERARRRELREKWYGNRRKWRESKKFRTSKTKREKITTGARVDTSRDSSATPPEAGQGGACPSRVLDSPRTRPSEALAARLGTGHAIVAGLDARRRAWHRATHADMGCPGHRETSSRGADVDRDRTSERGPVSGRGESVVPPSRCDRPFDPKESDRESFAARAARIRARRDA